jgi:hypothetical protein
MKKALLPITVTVLSLLVIAHAAFALHGPLPEGFSREPLILCGLREYYWAPASMVVFFGAFASVHAQAPNRSKALYVIQLTLGVLFLLILIASSWQARRLFRDGPPPPTILSSPSN